METQRRMTAHDLTRALRQRGMHQYQFAKIVGIPGSSLSATLAGVTRHADDFPIGFKRLDEPQLLLRNHPRKYRGLAHPLT
jgi:predicted transcriptional regulator